MSKKEEQWMGERELYKRVKSGKKQMISRHNCGKVKRGEYHN